MRRSTNSRNAAFMRQRRILSCASSPGNPPLPSSRSKARVGVALDKPQNGRSGCPVGPAQGENDSAMALAGHNHQLAGNLLLLQNFVQELGLALQRGGIPFGV